MRFSRFALLIGMLAPVMALLGSVLRGQPSMAIPQIAVRGTRGPSALLFRPDGLKLYIAEQDENMVAVLDPANGKITAHIPTGGTQPDALALSPDGHTLVMVNTFSGSVGLANTEIQTLQKRIALPGQPYGAVITKDGLAFVSVSDLNQVALLDLAAAKVIARIPVGYRPRALALTPDGKTLLCANLLGGGVSVIDVAARKERGRIAVPATNLRGLAVASDGKRIVVTAQQAHNELPTDDPEKMWSNVVCLLHLKDESEKSDPKEVGKTEHVLNLDLPGRGAADPCGIALDPKGETAYVALSGTHEAAIIPLENLPADGKVGALLRRVPVGANPKAVAVDPQNGDVWIGNHLGSTLSVLSGGPAAGKSGADDSGTAAGAPRHAALETGVAALTVRTIDLGAATFSPNRKLKGRFMFASAHITRGAHFTCETCHPDGNTDGLSWKFSHVKGGIPVRNTRDLRSNLLLTGPYGWDAREEDFEVFVNDEIVGLLKTRKMEHPEVHALWDLINEISLPPNPYRNQDGSYTTAAARGKALFRGEGQCVNCHIGEEHGGTKRSAWIGTTPVGMRLDVPHLIGAYSTAPYLHDGRAATLEEIFTKYNTTRKHGNAHLLSQTQLHDLLEYVREL